MTTILPTTVYEMAQDDPDICGAEKSDGTICDRPAGECGWHS